MRLRPLRHGGRKRVAGRTATLALVMRSLKTETGKAHGIKTQSR